LTCFDALYFSFGTLTTVDYGDIVPRSRVARMLAITEAATGVFYIAILIAHGRAALQSADGQAGDLTEPGLPLKAAVSRSAVAANATTMPPPPQGP
jgi:hypothetical protein